ncbi:MAG: cobalamin-dependent protein [Candidatus Pacebacteria bacterium]|nr:cobalamin-dependent protein [Candidatus Paceibacterota bacterium]
MKVSLLFPPSWIPSQPFLSLPSLTGFLRQQGVDVVQRDINIEFLEVLMTWDKVKGIFTRMEDEIKVLEKRGVHEAGEKYARMKQAVEWLPRLTDWIENAKKVFRGDMFYSMESYMESMKVMERWIELVSSPYHPSNISTIDNEMRYSVYSSKDIFSAINNKAENMFLDIFKEHIVHSILSDNPDLVGISITSTSQVIPGLTLASLIKNERPDIHITVGGSVFTKLIDNLKKNENLFSIVDSFVVFEGEHALLALIDELSGKKDLKKVPNLVYKENGKTVINEDSFFIEDLNKLPTPDYEGLPLKLYHTPELVLPVQTSRGCYWKKCAFCNLHLDHRSYRPRKIDLVMNDIQTLSKKHNTEFFFITDESIPLSAVSRLSDRIIEQELDIKWICGARFEKSLSSELLEKASRAGCLKIVFGLESYSQRVLDLMSKGTQKKNIDRIVHDCLKYDIAVHLYVIVGFLTETREEVMETVNFILKNDRLLRSYGFSCLPCLFDLEKGSPIMDAPDRFGLKKIMTPAQHDLSLGYLFEASKGMTPQETEDVYAQVMEMVEKSVNPLPFNYSMADGLLYLARKKGNKKLALNC